TQRERLRLEVSRRGQQPDEQAQRQRAKTRDSAQRQLPAADIAEQTGQQAPQQTTQCRTADVQPHRCRQGLRIELFADIGHRQRGQTAQRKPQQRAQHQQQVPGLDQRTGQPQQAGQAQRDHHYWFAPPALGQRSGDQQTERQGKRRQRQGQTAARCRYGETRRQQR